MSVAENLDNVRASLPAGVSLVAVSKTRTAAEMMDAYRAGQRAFGENRPQEMAAKRPLLPPDVEWHQIGHLQTNKVKLIAPFVSLVHSLDSARLAEELSRRAVERGRTIDALLEIHIAREESKHGWEWSELTKWLEEGAWRTLAGLRLRGTMGVATFTDDAETVRAEFGRLAAMHAELRARFFSDGFRDSEGCGSGGFDILSIGMSDDYKTAAECGTTMVRIGSLVFGPRQS